MEPRGGGVDRRPHLRDARVVDRVADRDAAADAREQAARERLGKSRDEIAELLEQFVLSLLTAGDLKAVAYLLREAQDLLTQVKTRWQALLEPAARRATACSSNR